MPWNRSEGERTTSRSPQGEPAKALSPDSRISRRVRQPVRTTAGGGKTAHQQIPHEQPPSAESNQQQATSRDPATKPSN